VDFFAPLKSFLGVAGLDSVFDDDMKLMEGRFVTACILYQKYLDIFCREFNATPELLKNKTSIDTDIQVLEYHTVLWVMCTREIDWRLVVFYIFTGDFSAGMEFVFGCKIKTALKLYGAGERFLFIALLSEVRLHSTSRVLNERLISFFQFVDCLCSSSTQKEFRRL